MVGLVDAPVADAELKSSAEQEGGDRDDRLGSIRIEPSSACSARSSAGKARRALYEERAAAIVVHPGESEWGLGVALDRDRDLGHDVAGEPDRDLVLAELADRLLELDAAAVDLAPDLGGQRGRDVGGRDRAVEAALLADARAQRDRRRADLVPERLVGDRFLASRRSSAWRCASASLTAPPVAIVAKPRGIR